MPIKPNNNWRLFKRSIVQHPGHSMACILTAMCSFAAYQRGGTRAALVGALVMAVFCWSLILATAWETRNNK